MGGGGGRGGGGAGGAGGAGGGVHPSTRHEIRQVAWVLDTHLG